MTKRMQTAVSPSATQTQVLNLTATGPPLQCFGLFDALRIVSVHAKCFGLRGLRGGGGPVTALDRQIRQLDACPSRDPGQGFRPRGELQILDGVIASERRSCAPSLVAPELFLAGKARASLTRQDPKALGE